MEVMGACLSDNSRLMKTVDHLNGKILTEKEIDFHAGIFMFAAGVEIGSNSKIPHTKNAYKNLNKTAQLWLHYPNAAENASKIIEKLRKEKTWVELGMD